MDAFDRFWQWANKPLESHLTIPVELYQAVMELAPDDRRDRGAVNQAAARVLEKNDEWLKVIADLHAWEPTTENYPRARRSAASNRSFSLSQRASSVCDLFSSASTSALMAAARFACSCSALSNAAWAWSTAC